MSELDEAFTPRTPRVAQARALLRRAGRQRAGRFLAEGSAAVGAALTHGEPTELFVTGRARARHPELIETAGAAGVRVSVVTERAAAGLSETRTPQGLVAVCRTRLVDPDRAVRGTGLAVVLAGIADPGNAGTVIRVADAAGAGAVLFAGQTVDPYNGKCVRASAGSLFHLALARVPATSAGMQACRDAGLAVLAAAPSAEHDLDEALDGGWLCGPTAWLFGSEAHGLPEAAQAAADRTLAVPLYGAAESLNLATAAAVCLYATARARRGGSVSSASPPVH